MIEKIRIQNFKSLENVTLECANLNVLTGLNGMGKSSIIQALLLLRQSYERGFLQSEGVSLNGELVNIGTGKEALYQFAKVEEIMFTIDFNEEGNLVEKKWNLAYESYNPVSEEEYRNHSSDFLNFSEKEDIKLEDTKSLENISTIKLEELSFFGRNTFNYLNSDRWVRNEYEISDFNVVRKKSLGKYGEYTTHYLLQYGEDTIYSEFLYPGVESNQLLIQVSAWLSEISPNTRVVVERIKGANSVKLRYVFNDTNNVTDQIAPLNVGFGITYVLPVLVALLNAKKGDIIIIENPESHIHPNGQSVIGKLIAKVAEMGVQIFIETHSDHIVNGILVSLHNNFKGTEHGISLNNLKINFVRNEENSLATEILPINVLENGRIKSAPKDFFDQYSKDMKIIIGF